MPEDSKQSEFIKYGWEALQGKVKGMAEQYAPGVGASELSREEQRMLFAKRHLSVEQEAELWRQGLTPEAIGYQVFKDREKLAKSGGRVTPDQWIKWTNDMAAEVEAQQQDGRMPPPERYTTLEVGMPQPEQPMMEGGA